MKNSWGNIRVKSQGNIYFKSKSELNLELEDSRKFTNSIFDDYAKESRFLSSQIIKSKFNLGRFKSQKNA